VICTICRAAADNRLVRDFHCDDPGCACGHRVEQYGQAPVRIAATTTGQPPDTP
jgi:hypothetical protein